MLFTSVFIAFGFIEAGAKAVVRAIGVGDAGRRLGAIRIGKAVFDATIAALKLGKARLAILYIAFHCFNAFGSDSKCVGIGVATARACCGA